MGKLELAEKIEKELEEIGSLQVQKENIENEYQLKQSVLNDFQEGINDETKKGTGRRRIAMGVVPILTFVLITGIMPFVKNYIVDLPNESTWFLDVIKAFSVESLTDGLLLVGKVYFSIIVGLSYRIYLEVHAEKKAIKKLGNFDENAYTEIEELENALKKVEAELTYHKKELMWYQNMWQKLNAYDEISSPRIQYNTYSTPNVEIDIAKNPYTKN